MRKARVHLASTFDSEGNQGWTAVGWNPDPESILELGRTPDPLWLESHLGKEYKSSVNSTVQNPVVKNNWIIIEVQSEGWTTLPGDIKSTNVHSLEWIRNLNMPWWYLSDYIEEYYYEEGYKNGKELSHNPDISHNELYMIGWHDGHGDHITEYELERNG